MALLRAILGLSTLPLLAACESKLETGYKYTRLDMSESEVKAMYADPFSEAAINAKHDEQQQDAGERRPSPGGY